MSAVVHPGDNPQVRKKAQAKPKKQFNGLIGFVRSFIFFITGKFLELDDGIEIGLLDRQKNELANVALVGALLMTITFSYIPPILGWEDDWLKGAFAFTTSFCNCLVMSCIILAISLLLVLNVLKNDAECRQFLDTMGVFAKIPFQALMGAICMFGFVVGTLQFYKLINFDNWFVIIICVTYFPACVIVPLTLWALMKSLVEVRRLDHKVKVLHVSKGQAEAYLNQYIEEKFENDDTRVPADEGTELTRFFDFVKASEDCEYLSRKGMVNLKTAFEERLGVLEY